MSSAMPSRLSVSPIGSSPLQRFSLKQSNSNIPAFSIPNRIEPSATRYAALLFLDLKRFQYPQSDRALCNLSGSLRGMVSRDAFSIPNRIEPSATSRDCKEYHRRRLFQYPQSDRALCNLETALGFLVTLSLSVSPIGSSPLQPTSLAIQRRGQPAFSIPNRIEPSAT